MTKKTKASPSTANVGSAAIDAKLAALADWRGERLQHLRALIHRACPAVVETVKWRGTPVWEHRGMLCTGEVYRSKVKLTFAHGAELADPKQLFNSSLDGKQRRAIDVGADDRIDDKAFVALIRAAAARNEAAAGER